MQWKEIKIFTGFQIYSLLYPMNLKTDCQTVRGTGLGRAEFWLSLISKNIDISLIISFILFFFQFSGHMRVDVFICLPQYSVFFTVFTC